MTEEEAKDFGRCLLIEFLEHRISTFELNDWHLTLRAFFQHLRPLQGCYYKASDQVIMKTDLDYFESLRTLYHEIGHRLNGNDEDRARLYASKRLQEWLAMSDREKSKKIAEGVLRSAPP